RYHAAVLDLYRVTEQLDPNLAECLKEPLHERPDLAVAPKDACIESEGVGPVEHGIGRVVLEDPVEVSAAERINRAPHDLDVLLRHRPRSISRLAVGPTPSSLLRTPSASRRRLPGGGRAPGRCRRRVRAAPPRAGRRNRPSCVFHLRPRASSPPAPGP